jgi:hypothetical protein
VTLGAQRLMAQAPTPWQAPRIADNSFLIEEAYNQEAGVVQHISNLLAAGPGRSDYAYTFTQEWPLGGMTHQLSYTVPLLFPDGQGGALGDIFINYRYQAVSNERVAFAPRASLLAPTGSWHKQNGNGAPGIQLNLPLSVRLSRQFVTHLNGGGTFIPGARGPTGAKKNLVLGNLGASLIGPIMERVNVMVEGVALWSQAVDSSGGTVSSSTFILNPGLRFALDIGSLQVVPGFSVPINFGETGTPSDLFFYLSFEHPFKKQ